MKARNHFSEYTDPYVLYQVMTQSFDCFKKKLVINVDNIISP